MKGEKQGNIMFGRGVFKVDGQTIGLTRDGGGFKVEYNNRIIGADGDRGTIKGRIEREEAKPFMNINHLELLTKPEVLHPGIKLDTQTEAGYTIMSGTGKIDHEKDYHTVAFHGETKDGREVYVEVRNAINLDNIDWTFKDKDDVIDSVNFEGTYDPEAEDQYDENWTVKWKND